LNGLPQKIGIVALDGWTGGTVYTHNLVRALALLPPSERLQTVLFCRSNTDLFKEIVPLVDRAVVFRPLFDSTAKHDHIRSGIRWLKTGLSVALLGEAHPELASAARKEQVSAVFSVSIPYTRRLPNAIAWIPDFQHRALPEFSSAVDRRGRDHRFKLLLQDADRHVVMSSLHSVNDARRYYGEPKAQTHILHFATVPERSWFNDPAPIVKKYELPENFFIICNQFWKHKDHLTAFKAIQLLAKDGQAVQIVCTGPTHDYRNPDYFGFLQQQIEALGIQEQVRILGLIPRTDQIGLMRASRAVLQPSHFEGWSTVLEDARALGKPVIASDFPVHLEQGVPGSSFFRQGDPEDCALAIRRFLSLGVHPEEASSSHFESQLAGPVRTFAHSFLRIIEAVLGQRS
jgi:glycosyltransferase involved in cell wall biosynthesis